jgi:hypothetical protein
MKRHILLVMLRIFLTLFALSVVFGHPSWVDVCHNKETFRFLMTYSYIGFFGAVLFILLGSILQFVLRRKTARYSLFVDSLLFLVFMIVVVSYGVAAKPAKKITSQNERSIPIQNENDRSNDHQGIYDRASINIKAGQMAKFTHPSGVALVNFTSFGPDGASYRWRFLSNSNHLESSGTGEVKDTSKKLIPGLVSVSFDANFYVRAGELWIPWSYASKTSAWLYYTKEKTEVMLLPDTKFEAEDLSKQTNR